MLVSIIKEKYGRICVGERGLMSKLKAKKWTLLYTEISKLGEGGNADVYLVEDSRSGKRYALKELRSSNRSEEKKSRFVSEIQIARDNCTIIPGIIPVIDYSMEDYWYTMPIAQQIMGCVNGMSLDEIIDGVLQLCETLGRLHEKGIHHRDIKPSNIYYYDGRFSFGDFGLVDFQDNDDFTKSDRGLGAIFTIAPEMKRNPKLADASKADVFSLAKTLWMFLSDDEKGFDGVYDYLDQSHSLRYVSRFKKEHLVEIDELLKDATENNPDLRPDIHEFTKKLLLWREVADDFDKSQNSDWKFLTKQLFGKNVPGSSIWREVDAIIDVLNIVGSTPAYNHMLLSDRGGTDFAYAKRASEENCIYLYDTTGMCCLVKPKALYYESFTEDYRWSYFRLDLQNLSPVIGRYDYIDYEYLVEDTPGHYVDASCAQYGVYDYDSGEPLPEGYHLLKRYLDGVFLFALKKGPYNGISGTYDGRHGMVSNDEFREYTEYLMKMYLAINERAAHDERYTDLSKEELDDRILRIPLFNKNPFEISAYDEGEESDDEEVKRAHAEENLIVKKHAYIKENYTEWDFSDAFSVSGNVQTEPIDFFFEFTRSFTGNLFEMINNERRCICHDGFIKEISTDDLRECAVVHDRKQAITILENINRIFEDYLSKAGLEEIEDYHQYFEISIGRDGTPEHLFTKTEIETLMRNADDRHHNRLVIDGNGYARIISDEERAYLYPVYIEEWNAGNNYVGKYSKLYALDDSYKYCLYGWYRYLITGRGQFIDYLPERVDEAELIEQIKEV